MNRSHPFRQLGAATGGSFDGFRRATGVALFASLLVACAPAPAPAPYRPNILLVVIDCLRADHVGAYGYPLATTPNLDQLAASGIRFEHAYSNGTWTKPSMATLFSGLYPSQHGLLRIGVPAGDVIETDALSPDIPMLAEHLAAGGYRTFAAIHQPHLKPEFGFGRGFTDYGWQLEGRSASQLNRDLLRSLSTLAPGQPFFAWVHYLDAHWPYNRGRSGRPDLGEVRIRPEPPKKQSHAGIDGWVREHMTEANRRGLMARYDHELATVDAALGALVEGLRRAGQLEDTMIVVTADHGEGFFEHGHITHGFEPYDEVARVPLVYRPPAKLGLPGGVRRSLVSHVDFAATILDLLHLETLPGIDGESYSAVLRGAERQPDRPVLLQAELSSALRGERYKVLQRIEGKVELYDLVADPAEKVNLAAAGCEGVCREQVAALRERLRGLGPPRATARGSFDAAEAEALRALGYL